MPVTDAFLIAGDEAADFYRDDGGTLTDERDAPGDLLEDYPEAREHRDRRFWSQEFPILHQQILAGQPNALPQDFVDTFRDRCFMELIFGATTNGIYWPLQEAVLRHIRLSMEIRDDVEDM